jgi:hypothetical protein
MLEEVLHVLKKEFMLYILIPNEKGSPVLTMFPNHNGLYETMLLQTGEPSVKTGEPFFHRH